LCRRQSAPPRLVSFWKYTAGVRAVAKRGITLEIKPEIEASLNVQAAAKGIPLDAYLQDAIEDLARELAAPSADLEEFQATLDTLAEMGKGLPHVPSAAFSRESSHQDHN
jgi:hypothetical protein